MLPKVHGNFAWTPNVSPPPGTSVDDADSSESHATRSTTRWAGGWIGLALAVCGCANVPRINPSGETLLIWPGATPPPPVVGPVYPPADPSATAIYPPPVVPPPVSPWGLTVNPSQIIAPVGSEVVLVASVSGSEGYLLINERLEWMLAQDGVGQFLSPGVRGPLEIIHWLRGLPRKVDERYVINTTLEWPMTLDRATPTPVDDIRVQSGQAWVTLSSPTEGTSYVTVFAPQVRGFDRRQQNATIYWVDAQWRFPAPAIGAAGASQTLVTTLNRQSDHAPVAGWAVRYEITGGPEAGFAPDGAASIEIVSNAAGEAPAEIVQKQPAGGTNTIQIQVIRPAGTGRLDRSIPVGTGSTLCTWTLADGAAAGAAPPGPLAMPPAAVPSNPTAGMPPALPPAGAASASPVKLDVSVFGPTTAVVGSQAQFEIQVVNRGTVAASGIVVTDRFDSALEHAQATSPIERDLVDLPPGTTGRLLVTLRVAAAGNACQEISVAANGGVTATTRYRLTAVEGPTNQPAEETNSAATPPAAASSAATPPAEVSQPQRTGNSPLAVTIDGPPQAQPGGTARFVIQVVNDGQDTLENVQIADSFETSLQPSQATEGYTWTTGNTLAWQLASLAPGKSARREIEFKCLRSTPRACTRVNVSAKGVESAATEACLEIAADDAPAAGQAAAITVSVADTVDPVNVGGETTYQIIVGNPTQQSAFDVTLNVSFGDEIRFEGMNGPVEGAVSSNSIRFIPIREVRAGESTLSFELRFKAAKPGTAKLHVDVTSRGQAKPVSADQTTLVLPAG